jgi:hypothetical protein
MSTAQSNKSWTHLYHDDATDGFVVNTKDGDRFVLSFDEMVGACKISENRKEFFSQFKDVFELLNSWLNRNADKIDRAYLSFPGDGIDFTVVQRSKALDRDLDESLIHLDIEIAANEKFHLVRLQILVLPMTSEESVLAFVRPTGTFKRIISQEG